MALCPFPGHSLAVLLSDPGTAYIKAVLIPEWVPSIVLYKGPLMVSVYWDISLEKR